LTGPGLPSILFFRMDGAIISQNPSFPNFFARNPLKFPKTPKEMFLKFGRTGKSLNLFNERETQKFEESRLFHPKQGISKHLFGDGGGGGAPRLRAPALAIGRSLAHKVA